MWEILFRHPDFVAINKPCGVSVHQEEGEVSLTQTLAAQLGLEQVWLLHRLDKLTSGVLLFALNPQSASALAQQFAAKTMRKTYLALGTDKPSKNVFIVSASAVNYSGLTLNQYGVASPCRTICNVCGFVALS